MRCRQGSNMAEQPGLTLYTHKCWRFPGAYNGPFIVNLSPKLSSVQSPRPEPVLTVDVATAVTYTTAAAQAGRLLPTATAALIIFIALMMSHYNTIPCDTVLPQGMVQPLEAGK